MDGSNTLNILPIEVRLIIYKYALKRDHTFRILGENYKWTSPHPNDSCRSSKRDNPNAALLRASKQIYHEASHLLYSLNCFFFQEIGLCDYWLSFIRPSNASQIQNVEYDLGSPYYQSWECRGFFHKILGQLTGLRSLVLYVKIESGVFGEIDQLLGCVSAAEQMQNLRNIQFRGSWPDTFLQKLKDTQGFKVEDRVLLEEGGECCKKINCYSRN